MVSESPTSGTEHVWPKVPGGAGDTDLSSTTWATSSCSGSNDGSEESSRQPVPQLRIERREVGSALLRSGAYDEELQQLDEESSHMVGWLRIRACKHKRACLPAKRVSVCSSCAASPQSPTIFSRACVQCRSVSVCHMSAVTQHFPCVHGVLALRV